MVLGYMKKVAVIDMVRVSALSKKMPSLYISKETVINESSFTVFLFSYHFA